MHLHLPLLIWVADVCARAFQCTREESQANGVMLAYEHTSASLFPYLLHGSAVVIYCSAMDSI